MEAKNPYLSGARQTKSTLIRYLFTIVGGVSTAFWAFGLVLTFTQESLKDSWWVAVFLLIPSAWVLWKGIRTGRDLELARRYQGVFTASRDGSVMLDDLVRHTGKSGAAIDTELERLFRKGYFQGCTLLKQPLAVTLTGTRKSGEHYRDVVCPHCGGTSRLRTGAGGRCEYCGSAIDEE